MANIDETVTRRLLKELNEDIDNAGHSSSHPLWSLLRLVVVFVGSSFFLWLNASNFDSTEYKAIAGIMALVVAQELGITKFFNKRQRRQPTDRD